MTAMMTTTMERRVAERRSGSEKQNAETSNLDQGIVSFALRCRRCEYCLRGLPVTSACPECGESIGRSIESLLRCADRSSSVLRALGWVGIVANTAGACAIIVFAVTVRWVGIQSDDELEYGGGVSLEFLRVLKGLLAITALVWLAFVPASAVGIGLALHARDRRSSWLFLVIFASAIVLLPAWLLLVY